MGMEIKDEIKINNKNVVLTINEIEADDNGNVVVPAASDMNLMTNHINESEDTIGYFVFKTNGTNGDISTGSISPVCTLAYRTTGPEGALEPTIVCRSFLGRFRGTATSALNDEDGNSITATYVKKTGDASINGSVTADKFITTSGIEIL